MFYSYVEEKFLNEKNHYRFEQLRKGGSKKEEKKFVKKNSSSLTFYHLFNDYIINIFTNLSFFSRAREL
jgi:hypothetical protein